MNSVRIFLGVLVVLCFALCIEAANKQTKALLKAIKDGDVAKALQLIDSGADINGQDEEDGWTPLMLSIATEKPSLGVTMALIQAKADINAVDPKGRTALMQAAANGSTPALKILLSEKANIDLQAKNGWTALMYAAGSGKADALQLLLDAKAAINLQEASGYNALMIACLHGQVEAVKVLLAAHPDLKAKAGDGKTVYDCAANYPEILELLKQASR